MGKLMDKITFLWSKTNRFHRVLLVFVLIEINPLPSRKYGFYCLDPALSYPFQGDTITWKWLMSGCALLPLVVMLIVERKYHNVEKDKPNRRVLRWYKEYLFGFIVNLCFIQVLKHIVGSPRPHFFDTCSPKEAASCKESEFVPSYTCTKAKYWQLQSDKSFPSGHTSLAIHAGFFIVYYLHRRMPTTQNNSARTLQALSASCAVWCAVSRMTDHRHHWWDVLAGLCIGVTVLYYTVQNLCKNFHCIPKDQNNDPATNETQIS